MGTERCRQRDRRQENTSWCVREGSAVLDPDAAEEEFVLLCRSHIFKESNALGVLLAPVGAASAMHEGCAETQGSLLADVRKVRRCGSGEGCGWRSGEWDAAAQAGAERCICVASYALGTCSGTER